MTAQTVPPRVVVGITGASGALYARRTIEALAAHEVEVHLSVTTLGRRLLHDELELKTVDPDALSGGRGDRVVVYNDNDLGAAIASGTFRHQGMIVVPASGNTIGAIASGVTNTLVQRAAAVTLKERRPLVIAHRESPVSLIELRNLVALTEAGAVIAPLAPGFYFKPTTLEEVVDFMAARLLDLVGVNHTIAPRWGEED